MPQKIYFGPVGGGAANRAGSDLGGVSTSGITVQSSGPITLLVESGPTIGLLSPQSSGQSSPIIIASVELDAPQILNRPRPPGPFAGSSAGLRLPRSPFNSPYGNLGPGPVADLRPPGRRKPGVNPIAPTGPYSPVGYFGPVWSGGPDGSDQDQGGSDEGYYAATVTAASSGSGGGGTTGIPG